MAELPRRLVDFSLFVNGKIYLGTCEEIIPPKIAYKMEDYLANGLAAPLEIPLHLEKLELSFTLTDYDEDLLVRWGILEGRDTSLIAKGALKKGNKTTQIHLAMRGVIKEMDYGTWKKGEGQKLKITCSINYYMHTQNLKPLILIDVEEGVIMVSGVDQNATVKAALIG